MNKIKIYDFEYNLNETQLIFNQLPEKLKKTSRQIKIKRDPVKVLFFRMPKSSFINFLFNKTLLPNECDTNCSKFRQTWEIKYGLVFVIIFKLFFFEGKLQILRYFLFQRMTN